MTSKTYGMGCYCNFCGTESKYASVFGSEISNSFICVNCLHKFLKIQRENQRPTETKLTPSKNRIWDKI